MTLTKPDIATLKLDKFQRLLEISAMLSSTLDLSRLLELVIDAAAELTHCEEASLLLVDDKSGDLHFVATSNDPNLIGVAVPLEGSLAGWIVKHGQPTIFRGGEVDDRRYRPIDDLTTLETHTLLGVPLMTKHKIIGALEVLNKQDSSGYTEQDVDILEALASQAAVAIENARLFAQSDALAEIMHELKTPMLAITAASELLGRKSLPEVKRDDIIVTIQREARRLTKMTQDFLELSRFESGRFHLDRAPHTLEAIAKEVAMIQRPQASKRGIRIITDGIAEQNSLCVNVDRDRIKQVLLNLTSNAIKYNRENGEIHLLVEYTRPAAILSVRDTGLGISEDNQKRLFERFYRVPGSEGYSEGSGLGLSISKKIIEAHGGKMGVESQEGKGTTFTCVLPLV